MFTTPIATVPSSNHEEGSAKLVGERCEVFHIQRHDEINIPREPSDINEAKKSSRANDRNISSELFGNPMQLGKVL